MEERETNTTVALLYLINNGIGKSKSFKNALLDVTRCTEKNTTENHKRKKKMMKHFYHTPPIEAETMVLASGAIFW